MNKIKKENLLYRKAIPCSRLFLRKEKTREQAKARLPAHRRKPHRLAGFGKELGREA
mgnify:CR=1 FL=1